MNTILKITLIILTATFFTACSNVNKLIESSSDSMTNTPSKKNPLKTLDDIKIEKLITKGTWLYQRQGEDCNDTEWKQRFYKNRYYRSLGSACLVPDSFSVDAESWHVKNLYLYIVNLSPNEKDDIVLKYAIEYLDKAKLILSSNGFKYTFLKK